MVDCALVLQGSSSRAHTRRAVLSQHARCPRTGARVSEAAGWVDRMAACLHSRHREPCHARAAFHRAGLHHPRLSKVVNLQGTASPARVKWKAIAVGLARPGHEPDVKSNARLKLALLAMHIAPVRTSPAATNWHTRDSASGNRARRQRQNRGVSAAIGSTPGDPAPLRRLSLAQRREDSCRQRSWRRLTTDSHQWPSVKVAL